MLKAFRRLSLCLLLSITAGQLSFAQGSDSASKLTEYLAQENLKLSLQINEIKHFIPPRDQEDWQTKVKENAIKQSLNQSKISSFQDTLMNQQSTQDYIGQEIKQLQHQVTPKKHIANAQLRLSKLETLLVANKTTIELINNNIQLANQYHDHLNEEKIKLQQWEDKALYQQRLSELSKKEQDIRKTLYQHYQKNIDLQQEEKEDKAGQYQLVYEANLFLNNLQINLIEQQLNEIAIQKKLQQGDFSFKQHPEASRLQQAIDRYQYAIEQHSNMEHALTRMLQSLVEQEKLLSDKRLANRLKTLKNDLTQRLESIKTNTARLNSTLMDYQQQLKNQLASRHSLSIYRLDNLPEIFSQLIAIPGQFYNYLKSLLLMNLHNYSWKEPLSKSLFWFAFLLVSGLSYGLHLSLTWLLKHNKERSRLTGYLYDGSLTLIKRNIPHLTLLTLLSSCFLLNGITYSNYQLIVNLFTVYLTFRSMIIIARLSLLERISDSSGKDVKLYYRLKWLLLAGGWTTALMVLSHKLHLSTSIQDIFNRLFMLFILAVSVVAWRSRDILPYLLSPHLVSKKRYYQHAVKLLVELLPFTLFTTALLGLLGYINLAWTMSQYQGSIILMLSGYVLIRGLLVDALELLSEWMISSLDNGWLWVEVLLKPLDKILRSFVFLAGVLILFQILGATSNEKFMAQAHQMAVYPIINISGVHITLLSVVEFAILLSVFIWAAKWTREFCYRWVFRDAKDAGIRNSLSVFSQYAVVLIGGFITLRVLGLDFSGMSMILGGLAVGMGFGLRDFASNVIGGLMLLIERPVREGDIITLGEFEGTVSHIGIRSMRVTSWDNMDVLIPNAETFNKPFTNWTHQDNIVRTVVPVKVSRTDDPLLVQEIIRDTLAVIPEILTVPASQVLIKQVDDALIEFEIRYFINVELFTRVEVRSKFLFELTAQFKQAGIKAPIPPIHVEFSESNSEELHRKTSA